MYLWKYWRESRITFVIAVLVLALASWGLVSLPRAPEGFKLAAAADAVVIALLSFPLAFLAWRFGSFGVGSDLGDRCGAYLFTRPRSRAFFVWHDWSYGMAQLLAIVVTMVVAVEIASERIAPGPRELGIAGQEVGLFALGCLHCATVILFVGLIFGLTYLCGILARNKGMMMAAGVLLAYLVLKVVVGHYWPNVVLPDFMMSEFSEESGRMMGFADHLALSIVLRTAAMLAFPFAAQMLLQKRDID